LKKLKERADVDPSNVFIFGHSMGGVMAPLLAADVPVRGIIAYGTTSRTWTEYMLENIRRQMELSGSSYADINRRMKVDAALMAHLYGDKLDPKEIAARYPELRQRIEETIT
jgi:esterase/lipase